MPLPEEFLNEKIADIKDDFDLGAKRSKNTSSHAKSRSQVYNEDQFTAGKEMANKKPQHDR